MTLFPGLVQIAESHGNVPHLEETVNKSSFSSLPIAGRFLVGSLCGQLQEALTWVTFTELPKG